jgi:3-hydroxyisobutyrate dehydrogenase-like beta-hydroxyacid dehydrogenase
MTAVGFIGLGHMGGNMAARFLAAGYAVYGEARSRERAQGLVDQGLRWRDTAREIAEAADVVFTSLPGRRRGRVRGVGSRRHPRRSGNREGVGGREHGEPAREPRARRAGARDGAEMLDAPVSGSVPQVQAGRSRSWSAATSRRTRASSGS